MSEEDEPPRLPPDFWPWPRDQPRRQSALLRRLQAVARRRKESLNLQAEGEAEPIQCTVCGAWPPELGAVMRQAIEAIPQSGAVCDDCMKVWWDTLPKGPSTSGP